MFEKKARQSIVVYLHYHRDIKKVVSFGDVAHTSRRGRYVVLYLDEDQVEEVMAKLSKEKYVKKVVPSYIKDLDQNFVGNLWRDTSQQDSVTSVTVEIN
ncbi:DUF2129 domain-containing protein [Streptococcus ovuberis]|uniref:UPF0298 protein HF992_05625 n=1 Tax=Streptococcus ovuberis TaxID=1936207 RepID=A0A7X6S1M5_9STRE|nr:DUF2129 domain-containing protein [Streptococcus ovuberis]NKZ20326.1 DUF2129 domain-containing protein [Streptococcus ovuberis]